MRPRGFSTQAQAPMPKKPPAPAPVAEQVRSLIRPGQSIELLKTLHIILRARGR